MNDAWNFIISYYTNEIAEGRDHEALLGLVRRIAASDYSKTTYPFTSISRLCIAAEPEPWHNSCAPVICICYLGDNSFRVEFSDRWQNLNGSPEYITTGTEIWSLLESLFIRLEIESEDAASFETRRRIKIDIYPEPG